MELGFGTAEWGFLWSCSYCHKFLEEIPPNGEPKNVSLLSSLGNGRKWAQWLQRSEKLCKPKWLIPQTGMGVLNFKMKTHSSYELLWCCGWWIHVMFHYSRFDEVQHGRKQTQRCWRTLRRAMGYSKGTMTVTKMSSMELVVVAWVRMSPQVHIFARLVIREKDWEVWPYWSSCGLDGGIASLARALSFQKPRLCPIFLPLSTCWSRWSS